MESFASGLMRRFFRVKTYGLDDMSGGHGGASLAKVLNTFDLTLLGVGSTLGVGIYVLAGSVAKNNAGPAVCVSFFIAAVASVIAAMCYAEFGARVPKAGSAYIYSYVTVGEFIAFIIGWNLILEYLIGTASVARAFSANLDGLLDNKMSDAFAEYLPIAGDFLAPYADMFAFGITIVLAVLLGFGMRSSAIFTNVFTFVNVFVVLYVVIAGSVNADGKNWAISKEDCEKDCATAVNCTNNCGQGGFAPFGFAGIMAGAAKCFFAFVGFDSIAATGEEAKDPKRSIPFSIILTLAIVFCAYFGVSIVLTLMLPYYNQDANTPLVFAFESIGWQVSVWIISVGSLFGLSASLLGAMIPLPRVIYAQAKDGMLFRVLSNINARTSTPILSTAVSGLLAALLACIFDLDSLVDMMSIGTLLAYTLVAVSVLILRYESGADTPTDAGQPSSTWLWNRPPTPSSSRNTIYATTFYVGLAIAMSGLLLGLTSNTEGQEYWMFAIGLVTGLMLLVLAFLSVQPRSRAKLYFKVPAVPLLPCLSIFVNTYLMFQLNSSTWIQFAVWMGLGFAVYFCYGMWNSSEEYVQQGRPVPGGVQTSGHWNKGFSDAEAPSTDVNGRAIPELKVTLAEDDQPFQSDDDDDDDDNDDGDWLPSESTLANLHAEASSALSKPPVVADEEHQTEGAEERRRVDAALAAVHATIDDVFEHMRHAKQIDGARADQQMIRLLGAIADLDVQLGAVLATVDATEPPPDHLPTDAVGDVAVVAPEPATSSSESIVDEEDHREAAEVLPPLPPPPPAIVERKILPPLVIESNGTEEPARSGSATKAINPTTPTALLDELKNVFRERIQSQPDEQ